MTASRWIAGALLVGALASPLLSHAVSDRPIRVETREARLRQVRTSIIASGTFLFENQIQLSPEVLGRVTEIAVHEGDVVRKGDVLLRIDDATYRTEVAQRSASLAGQRALRMQRLMEAEMGARRLNRLTTLQQSGFVTRASVEDADEVVKQADAQAAMSTSGVAQARALLDQAQTALGRTVIRAPAAGVVVALATRVGETVVPSSVNLAGSSLLTIAETGTLMAEVNVDEADIGNVAIGQEVNLTVAAFPDHPIQGRVDAVSLSPGRNDLRKLGLPAVGSQARTYSVRVRLASDSGTKIRSGMTCRAEIFEPRAPSRVAVPVEAVVPASGGVGNEGQTIYIVEAAKARRRRIALGPSDDRYQSITDGLRAGEKVVVGPAAALRSLVDGQDVDAS